MRRKKQGFEGQRTLELSTELINKEYKDHPILGLSQIVKIGYFPKAKYQVQESNKGVDYHILVYCIKGKGKAFIDNTGFEIHMGDFFIIKNYIPHKYEADSVNPWSIYWFCFKGEIAKAIIDEYYFNSKSWKGYLEYNEERIQLFNMIYKNLEKGYNKDNLLHMNMCLLHFLSSFVLNKQNAKPLNKNLDLINNAIVFMKNNCERNISLEEIAKKANISNSHFSYLFKIKTGLSPIDYFNQLKIQKACQYLQFTNMLIKEIAYKIGVDAPYFSRLFSKIMSMSPREYRQQKINLSDNN